MSCIVCGCSDLNPCEGGCSWIRPGLCSSCADGLDVPDGCDRCCRQDCTRRGGLVLCLPASTTPAIPKPGVFPPDELDSP